MRDWTTLSARTFRFWVDAMQAGAAAWTTIAMRLPTLAAVAAGKSSPEATRMVTEKIAAATEGAINGSFEGATRAARALGGPVAAATSALAVTDAMTRPARRRVKANAKRLTKKPKSRSRKR
jgi:hypothetical protein